MEKEYLTSEELKKDLEEYVLKSADKLMIELKEKRKIKKFESINKELCIN